MHGRALEYKVLMNFKGEIGSLKRLSEVSRRRLKK